MSAVPAPCAMTVDVEDYFHVAAFKNSISPRDWERWPSRVCANTLRLLDLFDEHSIQGTFFILGWVAERQPELVREIQNRGHEIASHGYSHQLIFEQTPSVFREETRRSKELLEDICGTPVIGYRAASYSITRRSLWALDILAELGFTWDSSIFPVHHDTYGMVESPRHPYRLVTPSGAVLTEFPLSTARIAGLSIPAAGGGYFRQYPYWLSRFLLNRAADTGQPRIFYLHPWEVDPDQPRVAGAGWKSNFRHYRNLHRCMDRLRRLCQDFRFTSVEKQLASSSIHSTFDLRRDLHGLKSDESQQPEPTGSHQPGFAAATGSSSASAGSSGTAPAHQRNKA